MDGTVILFLFCYVCNCIQGVITTSTGARYSGSFLRGQKHGRGIEEFGNKMGIVFVCPAGHRHNGDAFCTYTGEYAGGEFHGRGELKCCDGRSYNGGWSKGKKDGEGVQVFMKTHELGDPHRSFIGPNGSLYRVHSHLGLFKENVRQGYGISIFSNGDQLLGDFIDGQPHGIVVIKFWSGKSRIALYEKGARLRWVDGTAEDQEILDRFNIDLNNLTL